MNRCVSRACLFCVLLIADAVVLAEDIDPALRDQFLEAVRQVPWKSEQVSFRAKLVNTFDFQTLSDSSRARFRGTRVDPDKPQITKFSVAFRGPMALKTVTGRRIEQVQCKNTEYAFQVGRASAAKSYSLSFIERLGGGSAEDKVIREAENSARGGPFAGWNIPGVQFADLVVSPSFRIKRLVAERRDGANLVRIEFHWKDLDPFGKANPHSDSYIVCDPELRWAMKEFGQTAHDGGIYRMTYEFGDLIAGVAIAKKITFLRTKKDDKGDLTVSRSVTTIEVTEGEVPREEFYLSHYGLPEPTFQRRWFGGWVWYLIAGIVCVSVAAIVSKRRSASLP